MKTFWFSFQISWATDHVEGPRVSIGQQKVFCLGRAGKLARNGKKQQADKKWSKKKVPMFCPKAATNHPGSSSTPGEYNGNIKYIHLLESCNKTFYDKPSFLWSRTFDSGLSQLKHLNGWLERCPVTLFPDHYLYSYKEKAQSPTKDLKIKFSVEAQWQKSMIFLDV